MGRATTRASFLRGFTLMELIVVIGLVSIIAAIAVPQLLPALSFSTHEGAARRMAGYGRSAIGHAAMMHELITVKIDLDNQEYWTERLPEPVEGDGEDGLFGNRDFFDETDELPDDSVELLEMLQGTFEEDEFGRDEEREGLIKDKQSKMMDRAFDRMRRKALTTRAERIVHDRESIFDEVGPLFEHPFDLQDDYDDLEPEELFDPLLRRVFLPDGIFIESVTLGEEEHTSGIVEIEITTLGLAAAVVLFIANDQGDYYTVEWDPVTGGAHVRPGRETVF